MSKIIIAAGPVIVENNKVLLDKQGADVFWKFCGGKIKEDESLAETAIRRSKEELGINIEIFDQEPFLLYLKNESAEGKLDVILVHFLAKRAGKIKPGHDVREWHWFDLKNLPENLGPNILPALAHFGFIR